MLKLILAVALLLSFVALSQPSNADPQISRISDTDAAFSSQPRLIAPQAVPMASGGHRWRYRGELKLPLWWQ